MRSLKQPLRCMTLLVLLALVSSIGVLATPSGMVYLNHLVGYQVFTFLWLFLLGLVCCYCIAVSAEENDVWGRDLKENDSSPGYITAQKELAASWRRASQKEQAASWRRASQKEQAETACYLHLLWGAVVLYIDILFVCFWGTVDVAARVTFGGVLLMSVMYLGYTKFVSKRGGKIGCVSRGRLLYAMVSTLLCCACSFPFLRTVALGAMLDKLQEVLLSGGLSACITIGCLVLGLLGSIFVTWNCRNPNPISSLESCQASCPTKADDMSFVIPISNINDRSEPEPDPKSNSNPKSNSEVD